jgi:replicative DNA helicase
LPEAIETEKLVLGVLLTDAEATSAILALQRDDLYLEQHKRILDAARWCYDNGQEVTLYSVHQRLADQRHAESVGGLAYLSGLVIVSKILDIESYLGILRNKSTLRRAAIAAHELAERMCLPGAGTEDIRAAEALLRDLGSRTEKRLGLRGLGELIEEYGGIEAFLAPPKDEVVPTPWKKLNKLLTGGGFMPGQLVVIGARTGLGKSAVAAMIARYAQDEGVAVFSLEMTAREIWLRMISSASEVPLKALIEGTVYDPAKRRDVQRVISELVETKIKVDDAASSTVSAIVAAIKRAKGIKLVIVDYMQILNPVGSKGQHRVEQVGELSRGLKLAANELKLPFIVLSQLNRESAKDDRPPQLHDLRESGSIEQDANTVMFLHASQKEVSEAIEYNRPSGLELIIRKQRNGTTGKIKLAFSAATMQIWEQGSEA